METSEPAGGHRRPPGLSWPPEAKTRVWEEFRETVEKDLAQVVFSQGEVLTRSGNIFKRCTEDVEELLNPTNTASVEEAESEDSLIPLLGGR